MTGLTSRTRTRADLAAEVEESIVSGRLVIDGSRLPSERTLAGHFGVSRPVIREVLRTLSERGLIDVAPGRGAFVRPVRTTDAARSLDAIYRRQAPTPLDVIEARQMVEPTAARLAAERADDRDVRAMSLALERLQAASGPIEQARLDLAFHTLVARAARNPVIETMSMSISALAFELMIRSHADPAVADEGNQYHAEILDAIRAHDGERAGAAAANHLAVGLRRYGPDLRRDLTDVARRQLEQAVGASVPLEVSLTSLEGLLAELTGATTEP